MNASQATNLLHKTLANNRFRPLWKQFQYKRGVETTTIPTLEVHDPRLRRVQTQRLQKMRSEVAQKHRKTHPIRNRGLWDPHEALQTQGLFGVPEGNLNGTRTNDKFC